MNDNGFGCRATCVRCPDWATWRDSIADAMRALDEHYTTEQHRVGEDAYQATLCPTCGGTGLRDDSDADHPAAQGEG